MKKVWIRNSLIDVVLIGSLLMVYFIHREEKTITPLQASATNTRTLINHETKALNQLPCDNVKTLQCFNH